MLEKAGESSSAVTNSYVEFSSSKKLQAWARNLKRLTGAREWYPMNGPDRLWKCFGT